MIRARVERLAETLRRAIPVPLLPVLVRLRSWLEWRTPRIREDARAQMGFLLEHGRPDADVEQVARAYVLAQAWRGERRWHPETIIRQRVHGAERLVAARDGGRGVVLNYLHHGQYDGLCASLTPFGVVCHMMAYPYMLAEDAPAWIKQHVRVAVEGGGIAVGADIGIQGIVDLLREGAVFSIASDVPGRTPLHFAGRDVWGSAGAARAATSAGAPVVIVTTEVDAAGPYLQVHEPLDPAGFDSPEALLREMIARLEPSVLAAPELSDLPLSRWGTEPKASR